MSETGRRCPRCKAPLPPGPDPSCAACLLRLGLEETAETGIDAGGGSPEAADTNPAPPARIGNWRPIRRLGEGGMGVVYLAEEIGPLGRRAAVKRIKHGLDSRRVLERFEQERRVLARLDHPGIARVLEAGAAGDGTPYFAMEHVDGLPITEYCDRRRLPPRERLRVFARLCEAVEHAHRRGILHRDLKPSNVLVVDGPDGPQPKVIDFGVARATAQRRLEWSVFTEFGRLVGTPEYMSPEQADLENDDLDTRSDVYALGVVLYELLVGTTPHDAVALRALGLEALLRTIREASFPTPSERLSTLGGGAADIAARRGGDPDHLRRDLSGELDWIVMRATERDRDRRYGSAQALADDVRRHLEDRPVEAGPPSAGYRARKFVRRHRVAVTTAAIVLLALVGGGAGTSWGLFEALDARRETQRRAAELEALLEFQRSLLEEIDIERLGGQIGEALLREAARGPEAVPVALDRLLEPLNLTDVAREVVERDILDRAAATIDARVESEPRMEAALRTSLGSTYFALGMYDRARPHLERALEVRRERLGPEHPETLESVEALARLLARKGEPEEAVALYREALEGRRRVLGDDHPDTLRSVNNLGYGLERSGELAEAERLYREALAGRRRVLGDDDPETLSSINNVGVVLKRTGRLEEAEPYYREALERGRRVLGPEHPDVLVWTNNMALLMDALGRNEEALALHREALDGRRRALGDGHPATLQSYASMGEVLLMLDRNDEARAAIERALEGRRRTLGDAHPYTLMSWTDLGRACHAAREWEDAERHLREAVERARRALRPGDIVLGRALFYQGKTLAARGKHDEAERALREAYEIQLGARGPDHDWTRAPVRLLVRLYEDTGRADEAAAWRERLD